VGTWKSSWSNRLVLVLKMDDGVRSVLMLLAIPLAVVAAEMLTLYLASLLMRYGAWTWLAFIPMIALAGEVYRHLRKREDNSPEAHGRQVYDDRTFAESDRRRATAEEHRG